MMVYVQFHITKNILVEFGCGVVDYYQSVDDDDFLRRNQILMNDFYALERQRMVFLTTTMREMRCNARVVTMSNS
jgi:hypothetical protein